ncbi:MAG: hypothetical protein ACOCQD_00915 [archaeon]
MSEVQTFTVPSWVAPKGEISGKYKLGDFIKFNATLKKKSEFELKWRGWTKIYHEDTLGFVVGIRYPYTGIVSGFRFYEGEVPYRERNINHKCLLISYDLYKSPVYVLEQDITLAVVTKTYFKTNYDKSKWYIPKIIEKTQH